MNKKLAIGITLSLALMVVTGCKISHTTKSGDTTTIEFKAGQTKNFSTLIEFALDGSENPYEYDVSRVSFPITYSNAQLTGGSSLKISVYNDSGSQLNSKYFASSLNNNIVRFNNPTSVNSWLSSKLSNSNATKYVVQVDVGYKVSDNVGGTVAIATQIKYDNTSFGGSSGSGVIMPSVIGPRCNPNTGICYQVP